MPELACARQWIAAFGYPGAGAGPGARQWLPGAADIYPASLARFLAQADTFRHVETTIRNLSEEESLRGKDRLRRAVQDAEQTPSPDPGTSWLDLLVLR